MDSAVFQLGLERAGLVLLLDGGVLSAKSFSPHHRLPEHKCSSMCRMSLRLHPTEDTAYVLSQTGISRCMHAKHKKTYRVEYRVFNAEHVMYV